MSNRDAASPVGDLVSAMEHYAAGQAGGALELSRAMGRKDRASTSEGEAMKRVLQTAVGQIREVAQSSVLEQALGGEQARQLIVEAMHALTRAGALLAGSRGM